MTSLLHFFKELFSSDFMGHGYCYLWRPEIVWLHVISDGLIALSYYLIPVALVYLVRQRRDLPFHWIFFMFGTFIVSCGTTHAMEIWTLWHGTYRLAGLIKAVTAASSLATAFALVPMLPKAVLLPSPAQLSAANRELEKQIAERRRIEAALEEQRNFMAAVLNSVGTLVVVLDLDGTVARCNQACERLLGYGPEQATGKNVVDLIPSEEENFRAAIDQAVAGSPPVAFETHFSMGNASEVIIAWSFTILTGSNGSVRHLIATGVDLTESRTLETTILDISAREQARIGQDLHDGLGQHLAGLAFLSKALEGNLADRAQPEASEASRIVRGVNEAICRTRELAHGLLPINVEAGGLMSALESLANDVESAFGITCRFTCDGPITLRDGVATNLYRIAQEAIGNAMKHGRADRIGLSLVRVGGGVTMRIVDNGAGIATGARQGGGMGLRIMNYRANVIGGMLDIHSALGRGTTVACHLRFVAEGDHRTSLGASCDGGPINS